MSKRRTRRQKLALAAKSAVATANSSNIKTVKADTYLKADLTRTIVVTILALFLEVMLKFYLERR